ncbi:hypothetical protein ONZ51_g5172 [Trametes cubensis]|uniref:Uncharacterized protein n=1 Tax=Trametes cubensis TaxID=1111947 RepID=A0AAD7XCB1_9APHY|nr:hypothetical protein ONZ51_g5172 [Trametes cubensis]
MEQSRPEIGGSFGGFIALVVVLAAIFLISCIGIFILLRNHEPTPHERHRRRARARTRDFSSEAPIGPPGIRERFARLFGRRAGWIKASAGEGDEWDASDERIPNAFGGEEGLHSVRERESTYPATFAAARAAQAPRPPQSLAQSLSTDSVEVELSAPSAAYAPPLSPGPSFTSSDLEDDPAPSIRTAPVSRPVSQTVPPLPFGSQPTEVNQQDERHFTVQTPSFSARSMRKFDNGTKFKESL